MGKVVSGLREGAKYISMPQYRNALREALGFDPYPGTLNVLLPREYVKKTLSLRERGTVIQGFTVDGVEYGWVRCLPAVISKGGLSVRGGILFIEKTAHGPEIVEVVAPVKLRDTLSLKNGEKIEIRVFV